MNRLFSFSVVALLGLTGAGRADISFPTSHLNLAIYGSFDSSLYSAQSSYLSSLFDSRNPLAGEYLSSDVEGTISGQTLHADTFAGAEVLSFAYNPVSQAWAEVRYQGEMQLSQAYNYSLTMTSSMSVDWGFPSGKTIAPSYLIEGLAGASLLNSTLDYHPIYDSNNIYGPPITADSLGTTVTRSVTSSGTLSAGTYIFYTDTFAGITRASNYGDTSVNVHLKVDLTLDPVSQPPPSGDDGSGGAGSGNGGSGGGGAGSGNGGSGGQSLVTPEPSSLALLGIAIATCSVYVCWQRPPFRIA